MECKRKQSAYIHFRQKLFYAKNSNKRQNNDYGSIGQEDTAIVNIYASSIWVPTYLN